jgi:HEPN domain-containing protein
VTVNRAEFQVLAEERAADAQALLEAGRWSGAYYLAGYAVECALKACIAKRTREHDFPDRDLAQKSYTHDLEKLIDLADLKPDRDNHVARNPVLGAHWLVLKDWTEQSRYRICPEDEARRLVFAVTDSVNGVLPWIKERW